MQNLLQVIVITSLIFGCAGSIDPEADYSHDAIVRDFIHVATRTELNQNVVGAIRKWVSPITVHIDENAPIQMSANIRNQLSQLAALSGIPISYTSRKSANYLIFTPRRKDVRSLIQAHDFTAKNDRLLRRRIARANCFFSITVNTRNEIQNARIVIPRDLSRPKRSHCIAEELTQSLGLINDLTGSQNSIFNEASTLSKFNRRDALFVALLYHRRLRPNTPASRAETMVRELLNKCLPLDQPPPSQRHIFLNCLNNKVKY